MQDSYTGPQIQEAPEGASAEEKAVGIMTQEFIDGMIELFKVPQKLPLKFVWQIILGAKMQFDKEASLVDYEIPKGQTVDVVGDT